MLVVIRVRHMNETSLSLEKVKHLIKDGKRKQARSLLREIAKKEPHNDEVFVLFAYVAEKHEHAIYCLEQALKINPDNEFAQQLLLKIQKPPKEIVRQDQSPHEPQSRPNDLESSKKKYEKARRESIREERTRARISRKGKSPKAKVGWVTWVAIVVIGLCIFSYMSQCVGGISDWVKEPRGSM